MQLKFISDDEIAFERAQRSIDVEFKYDVVICSAPSDRALIRPFAEWLRKAGLTVWFEDWIRQTEEPNRGEIEFSLEHSRVMVFCMTADAFGANWPDLEERTLRFRDPLNRRRRFVPILLSSTSVPPALSRIECIDVLSDGPDLAKAKLLEVCAERTTSLRHDDARFVLKNSAHLNYKYNEVRHCSFSKDGKFALVAGTQRIIHLWDLETRRCLKSLAGHSGDVVFVCWSPNEELAISASYDHTLRLWNPHTGENLSVLSGHGAPVLCVSWSQDQKKLLSGATDGGIRVWDLVNCECVGSFEVHGIQIISLEWSSNQNMALLGCSDGTVRLWDVHAGRNVRVFEGHTKSVLGVAWSVDQRTAVSCSGDRTIRLWNIETGDCLRVLEGHTQYVSCIALNAEGQLLSGSDDRTVRLWDIGGGRCVETFSGLWGVVSGLSWGSQNQSINSIDSDGRFQSWDLSSSQKVSVWSAAIDEQVKYTNAKVLLVGDTSSGKTALAHRLATGEWRPSEASTIGAWSTQWKLEHNDVDYQIEREVWLWDFGGQADQRLIHQMYMEDAALAVLVFDGQKENLFDVLGQWDRDIAKAGGKSLSKLLVAGRIDAGGLRVSRHQLGVFAEERGFSDLIETSARLGTGCDHLRDAIVRGIRWESIPWRSSPLLFKKLKDGIVNIKDEGRILIRLNELRDLLELRFFGEIGKFSQEELHAVVGLLAGPGIVWELKFGDWILLQPERINAYAQAVIQAMRNDKQELGCVLEEDILAGRLDYLASIGRVSEDDERYILLSVHQTLIERSLCFRQHTEDGPVLVFPSYFRRRKPELTSHPSIWVSYRFDGFLDDVYSTLVVRLHHTAPYKLDQLWHYAADFRTLTGKRLGIKLVRLNEGRGELQLYFESSVSLNETIIFCKYVHEHLLQKAEDISRIRHYVCPRCHSPVRDSEVAMRKLQGWNSSGMKEVAPSIICQDCEKRILLWDDMEKCFASGESQQRVHELQEQSARGLDSESKERLLVGEVISQVALAGQISREISVSDHGIDLEIEFKTDDGLATGQKVYVQLKSGDSHLSFRKKDGVEIFKIRKARHVQYWREQSSPVLLIIRKSDGQIRWMDVRDYLRRTSGNVRHIEFRGERFDVMSIRRLRQSALSGEF
ncbi:DUF4365 domain-containing protein [Rhodopseudomonas palustris]|uniref:DUF4365 domain-containing protein n=1 Tax=Rhodopseudomonas palustris TaxID=1076 RepID=UPI000E5AF21A|nr:DUF4365 domain-containing protein [Rhodopseudomonas palustris]QLH70726.1 DUF4365 domain-containing protein [Rhodopseudomonas palustris]RHZ91371.1 DUF4365 domain-containing protein [Rhodopseudomonas palustris]